MDTRQRFRNRDNALKDRFLQNVMEEEGADMVKAHQKAISDLLNEDTGLTRSSVRQIVRAQSHTATLEVSHLKRQRFLDMKTRNTKDGRKRKRAYRIHNRIIFGHLNNIIQKLSYGFTDAVREQLETPDLKF